MSRSGQRPHVHTSMMRTTPASETAGAQRGSGSDSKGTGASGGVAFLVGEIRFTPGMVTQMVPGWAIVRMGSWLLVSQRNYARKQVARGPHRFDDHLVQLVRRKRGLPKPPDRDDAGPDLCGDTRSEPILPRYCRPNWLMTRSEITSLVPLMKLPQMPVI